MNASFAELLAEAATQGRAVGAFTCYNLETATGALQAAEAAARGVVLLVSEQSFRAPGGDLLGAALVAAAERARVPACVQLDHVTDLDAIRSAFELGFGAVLAGGSAVSFEENVALVKRATALAQDTGGHVEAELGSIAGDEDVARAVAHGALTDPEEAAAFVVRALPACLAVSIGNVHGVYRDPPELDWERLEAIQARVDCPLAFHGASGLSNRDLRRAITLGIAKVNVNTELRERYVEATGMHLAYARDGARVLELNRAQAAAIAETVRQKLTLFGPSSAGTRTPEGGSPA